ncbi:MAG: hypothetical protein MJ238_02970 [Bacilli bacterium]|nr:hypothetical protein [Bacilli bacterium]
MANETEIIRDNPQEEGLSLKDIFYVVKKHIIAIGASVVVLTAAGLGGAIVKDKISPTFTSNATMMVSVNNDSYWGTNMAGSTAYSLSNYITDTFCDFIKDDIVLEKVVNEVTTETYKPSIKGIRNNLSVSGENLVLRLSFNSSSIENSVSTLKAVTKYTVEVANSTHDDGTGTQEAEYPFLFKAIQTMTDAKESNVTKASSKMKFTVIGFAAGAVIAFAYVFLREMFNNSFVSNADVERTLGLPILASVPAYEFKDENEKKEAK